MTLGLTSSGAVKIKTDGTLGLRAVECACCVPPGVLCPCEIDTSAFGVIYLNAEDGNNWITGGFIGTYNLSFSLTENDEDGNPACSSSGVNSSGGNWGGCGYSSVEASSTNGSCSTGLGVGFYFCQPDASTNALYFQIAGACNYSIGPSCYSNGFFNPKTAPPMTSCGTLTMTLPSGTIYTLDIFAFPDYGASASATLTLFLTP